jgi:hypothetical protein
VTAAAVAVKVAVIVPAANETEDGTVRAEVALLESVTVLPLVDVLVRVTVHVVVDDGARLVLAQSSDDTPSGTVTVIVTGAVDPFSDAVTIAVWFEVTAATLAVKVAVVAAAATTTEAGTVRAAVALLDNATLVPPVDAAFDKVTVQVVVDDGARLVLAHCSEDTVIGAVTLIVMGRLDPFNAAVRIAVWLEVTAAAVAVKVAVVAVAATEIEAGTVRAAVALLDSATVAPPVGAAWASVTVQVVVDEAARVVLAHCSEDTVMGAVTLSVMGWLDPFSAAVTIAVWFDATAAAVAVKVAVTAVAGTRTEAGTVRAAVALLESAMVAPPVAAA